MLSFDPMNLSVSENTVAYLICGLSIWKTEISKFMSIKGSFTQKVGISPALPNRLCLINLNLCLELLSSELKLAERF